MELSIFLAKFLGLYMLIVAVIWSLRKEHLKSLTKEIISSKVLMVYSGLLSLLFGLAIVLAHPIWEMNWRGVITLLGYIAIFKGSMRIAFTSHVQKRALKLIQSSYLTLFFIVALLGIYLTYHGFMTV